MKKRLIRISAVVRSSSYPKERLTFFWWWRNIFRFFRGSAFRVATFMAVSWSTTACIATSASAGRCTAAWSTGVTTRGATARFTGRCTRSSTSWCRTAWSTAFGSLHANSLAFYWFALCRFAAFAGFRTVNCSEAQNARCQHHAQQSLHLWISNFPLIDFAGFTRYPHSYFFFGCGLSN